MDRGRLIPCSACQSRGEVAYGHKPGTPCPHAATSGTTADAPAALYAKPDVMIDAPARIDAPAMIDPPVPAASHDGRYRYVRNRNGGIDVYIEDQTPPEYLWSDDEIVELAEAKTDPKRLFRWGAESVDPD